MGELTELELAYLGGFFDGEGCISILRSIRINGKNKYNIPVYSLSVILAQSDIGVIEYWHQRIGVGSVHRLHKTSDNAGNGYVLQIQSNEAVPFLELILPYLRIKKEQAEIAIEFQRTMGKYTQYSITTAVLRSRENAYQLMRQLKGTSSRPRTKQDRDDFVNAIIDGTDARGEAIRAKR